MLPVMLPTLINVCTVLSEGSRWGGFLYGQCGLIGSHTNVSIPHHTTILIAIYIHTIAVLPLSSFVLLYSQYSMSKLMMYFDGSLKKFFKKIILGVAFSGKLC